MGRGSLAPKNSPAYISISTSVDFSRYSRQLVARIRDFRSYFCRVLLFPEDIGSARDERWVSPMLTDELFNLPRPKHCLSNLFANLGKKTSVTYFSLDSAIKPTVLLRTSIWIIETFVCISHLFLFHFFFPPSVSLSVALRATVGRLQIPQATFAAFYFTLTWTRKRIGMRIPSVSRNTTKLSCLVTLLE